MSDMSEIIKESLEGVRGFANTEAIIGNVINTQSGVTIIPISRLTVGFAGGGFDYGQKKLSQGQGFGGDKKENQKALVRFVYAYFQIVKPQVFCSAQFFG